MRALISVSDKAGLIELAQELSQAGVEIISTGGTAQALRQAEITCTEIGNYTGFPELLEGRLKTLHPKVFGGLLYIRNNPKHAAEAEKHDIPSIDWVIVNLYPFERIYMENKLPKSEMIEFVDIGGPSLLRAGSKNFQDVVVLCDSDDYAPTLKEFKENGKVSFETRKRLAGKAFAHTAHYDSMIAKFFSRGGPDDKVKTDQPSNPFPAELSVGLKKVGDLRYGENPHQRAALYKESGDRAWGVVNTEKLQGKELSFNNFLDLDAAWQIVNALAAGFPAGTGQGLGAPQAACVIIKHTNPCGTAMAQTTQEAFQSAFAADSLSAFGGIVGFSTAVDEATAQEMVKTFFECVIAPGYAPEALEVFKKKPNLRVLRQSTLLNLPYELDFKKISGGMLVQEKDFDPRGGGEFQELRKVVTKRQPTPEELYALEFAWRICKFVKSNAIVLARGTATQGVGAGQMSRIDSLKIAIEKAGLSLADKAGRLAAIPDRSQGGISLPLVLASDAFFPFRDVVDEAAKFGVSAIIQPSGSLRDQESIDAANEHNIAMVFTGVRHFRH